MSGYIGRLDPSRVPTFNSRRTRAAPQPKPTMKVNIRPWATPDYITAEMPAQPRQAGFVLAPTWELKDVDVETLDLQCKKFRAEVFQKAGKTDPNL